MRTETGGSMRENPYTDGERILLLYLKFSLFWAILLFII